MRPPQADSHNTPAGATPFARAGDTPILPSATPDDDRVPLNGRARRGIFATTSDVRHPAQVERLISTIETLRDESGENVQKLRTWVQQQQRELHAWLKKQQPLQSRRLQSVGSLLAQLRSSSGDELLSTLEELAQLDEAHLILFLPMLTDLVILETGSLNREQRATVRAFLLSTAAASQHAALHICWYLRAMGPLSSFGAPPATDSPKARTRFMRQPSGAASAVAASADVPTSRALSLLLQLEAQLEGRSPRPDGVQAELDCRSTPATSGGGGGGGAARGSPRGDALLPSLGAAGSASLPSPDETRGRGAEGADRLAQLRHSLALVKRLTDDISTLTDQPRDQRANVLRHMLTSLAAEEAVAGVWLPAAPSSLRHHAVQSVLPHEAIAISTNKHCPVMLFLPVLVRAPAAAHPSNAHSSRRSTTALVAEVASWVGETAYGISHGAGWRSRGAHGTEELDASPAFSAASGAGHVSLCRNAHLPSSSVPSPAAPLHHQTPDRRPVGAPPAPRCATADSAPPADRPPAVLTAPPTSDVAASPSAEGRELLTCARELHKVASSLDCSGCGASEAGGSDSAGASAAQSPRDALASSLASPDGTHTSASSLPASLSAASLSTSCSLGPPHTLQRRSTAETASTDADATDDDETIPDSSSRPSESQSGYAPRADAGGGGSVTSPMLGPVLPLLGPDDDARADDDDDNDDLADGGAHRARRLFGEVWEEKEARIWRGHQRMAGGAPPAGFAYRTLPCIVKTGDSLLQEQFAVLLVRIFQDIFDSSRLPLRLHPYSVVATSPQAGIVQLVTNSNSIDGLKRNNPEHATLTDLFAALYGPPSSVEHRRAIRAFSNSCAAWAVVCYFLQIKDRHNGNILLHARGHIVHIDFGFMLSNSPGGNMNFESAPFKLTSEYVQLMGGARSATFARFRELVIRGFLAARKHADKIIDVAALTLEGSGRDMPCFVGGAAAIDALRSRFQLHLSRRQAARFVEELVTGSIDHWTTTCYDRYQRCMLGIM